MQIFAAEARGASGQSLNQITRRFSPMKRVGVYVVPVAFARARRAAREQSRRNRRNTLPRRVTTKKKTANGIFTRTAQSRNN